MLVIAMWMGCSAQYVAPEADVGEDAQRASDNWADQDTNGVGTHRVTVDGLNVRDRAGALLAVAEREQMLILTGSAYEASGYTYREAVFKGGELDAFVGWVADSFLAHSVLEVCGVSSVNVRSEADLGLVVGTARAGEKLYVTSSKVRNTGNHRYFLGSLDGDQVHVATDYLCAPGGARTGSGNLAADVLDFHDDGVTVLWDQTFGRNDGASPLDNILDAAAGRPAKTSCYGTAPCDTVRLSDALLEGMVRLASDYGYDTFVTSIAGANHSRGSLHYDGRAFDIDEINGVRVFGDTSATRAFMNACWALGAIEVFGPSNDPFGHFDHIHCAW